MKKLFLFPLSLLTLSLFSCQDNGGNSRIEVWLTDAPGDYKAVNIDVQGVEVHIGDSEDSSGWKSLHVTPKSYNLLDLANGNETFLGDLELPGGRISQIRLILGDNNTLFDEDSVEQNLTTPSGQQSGLKIQINQVLAEGITYKILLDFEAGKSIVKTGSSKYILKPVIRAITEAQDGAIKGVVSPAAVVAISLMAADTVVTTTSSDEAGEFLIRGLQAGTYKLVFDAGASTPDVEKTDVAVVVGEVTDVGEVSME